MSHGFVDLHAHVLHGVDDGPATLEESLAILQTLKELGFDTVCATPHQKSGLFSVSPQELGERLHELKRTVYREMPTIRIIGGAENCLDDLLFSRLEPFTVPCYEGGRAFLLELTPGPLSPSLEEILYRFRTRGILPVLAHPERYSALVGDEERLARVARVAVLVVDLTAVADFFGSSPARRLVLSGYAHALASDIHSTREKSLIARGIAWVEKKLGPQGLERLLCTNPHQILAGEFPQ